MPNFDPIKTKKDISLFETKFKKLVVSSPGKEMFQKVNDFTISAVGGAVKNILSGADNKKAALPVMQMMQLLPQSLFLAPDSPIKSQELFLKSASETELTSSLLTLFLTTRAMLLSGSNNKNDIDYILQTSFDRGKTSLTIKNQLIKPFGPDIKIPDYLTGILKNLEALVRSGRTREMLEKGKKCFQKSTMPKIWSSVIKDVRILTPCGGGTMQIDVEDFKLEKGLQLSLPIEGGGEIFQDVQSEISIEKPKERIDKKSITTLTVKLPENISSGNIYFSIPSDQNSSCKFVLIKFTSLVQQWAIKAGKPTIKLFTQVPNGQPNPLNFKVNISWEVENADNMNIQISGYPTPASSNELPPLNFTSNSGTITVEIPSTFNWQAQYILHATNTCGETVSSPLIINSNWSEFLIGTGIEDVTDRTPGLGMQGFADDLQKTVDVETNNSLFSRAFIIAKNKNRIAKEDCTVLVVADIWSCVQAVKSKVVERLSEDLNFPEFKDLYKVENVLISGTHTHSGPGGYSHYFLYNLTAGGFDQDNFDKIVNGIVKSIKKAHKNLAPGKIYISKGDVENCGINRSWQAHDANPDADLNNRTDKEMLLLKFVKSNDGNGKPYEVGALNWFAIHTTSKGQSNTQVSGDNKGWASHLFEDEMRKKYNYKIGETFVAGFANSSAGDVSGNMVDIYTKIDHDTVQDVVRMKNLGNIQYQKARQLFINATEEISGNIDFRYTHIQMSNIAIESDPPKRTWPAALGISFGGGSIEDGKATTFSKDLGIIIPSPIKEGITTTNLALSDIASIAAATAIILPFIPGVSIIIVALEAAIITGVGIPEATSAFMGMISVAKQFGVLGELFYIIPLRVISALAFGGLKDALDDNPLHIDRDPWGTKWNFPQLDPLNLDPNNPNNSAFIDGHAPKPIMFPVGNSSPFPLVPNKVPIQVIKIGQLLLAGVPGEFTTMAGRHLKATLKNVFGLAVKNIAIVNYANAYSGYVTTEAEYNMQHYEGASTLYGPHTLEAYQQEFTKLARAIVNNTQIILGNPEVVEYVGINKRGIPEKMIYLNNRTNSVVNIRIFKSRELLRITPFNWPHEEVPANENLLFNIPNEPFEVSINGKPPETHIDGDIITI
jgi:Neutral/alkaline non-lysosomal ceramidase, N-terminal